MTRSHIPESAVTRPGRRLPAIVAVVVVTVQVLFVFCLAYPPLHAEPHGVPIGLAGPPRAVAQASALLRGQSDAFDVHRYPDVGAARRAISDREIYGAFAADATGPRVLVASAADPKIADFLTRAADKLGAGRPVRVVDVVPAPGADPQGTGALTTLLPLILLSIVLGAALGLLEPVSRALAGWCLAAALAAGLAVAGLATGLGTFTGAYWGDAGVLALLVFGIAATSAGLARRSSLRPVLGLFALTMLLIGIPSAGALVPPDLLPQPWRATGPWLPPAAALDALRGVTFFDGARIGASMAVLTGWALFGALLVLVPTRGNPLPHEHRGHQPRVGGGRRGRTAAPAANPAAATSQPAATSTA
jgi:hypothetical protein